MELDRKQRVLSRAHGRCLVSDLRGMITQVACRSSHRLVVHPICLRRELELPPGDSARNQVLARVANAQSARSKDSTVVDAACSGSVCIDRASPTDEHRTVTVLVVSHHQVPMGKLRGREQNLGRNVSECLLLVRFDVNELRGCAAGRAAPAGNVGSVPTVNCAEDRGEPSRELACIEALFGRHGLDPAKFIGAETKSMRGEVPDSV